MELRRPKGRRSFVLLEVCDGAGRVAAVLNGAGEDVAIEEIQIESSGK